jgi:N-acetylmuramoyl-L-alanine amidase
MKIAAIIIGHSVEHQGAGNAASGETEFSFNSVLASLICEKLTNGGIRPEKIFRTGSYTELPEQVNATHANIAVSLHCNAFNQKASGSSTLYYVGSKNGRKLAGIVQFEIVRHLHLRDRGLKPRQYNAIGGFGDRGGYLLKKTSMPCIILEPFYIDCDQDLAVGLEKIDALASAISSGINSYFERK